jgi:hypothetical protein
MHHAVINIRLIEKSATTVVRLDIRHYEHALSIIGQRVLLYTPRSDGPAGYCGEGVVTSVVPAPQNVRFMIIRLEDLEWFPEILTHSSLIEPYESGAYDETGKIKFHYFSPGVRKLSEDDQVAISSSQHQTDRWRKPSSTLIDTDGVRESDEGSERSYINRPNLLRNARFRFAVLQHYGTACAVYGDNFGDYERGQFEVEACHIQPVHKNGRDEVWNGLAFCRRHHFAFDIGLFSLENLGVIKFSGRLDAPWLQTFKGRTRAELPTAPTAWPKAECLHFHRERVFVP